MIRIRGGILARPRPFGKMQDHRLIHVVTARRVIALRRSRVAVIQPDKIAVRSTDQRITVGNLFNSQLPEEGADILVAAGLGRNADGSLRLPAYGEFIAVYILPDGAGAQRRSYGRELTSYVFQLTGDTRLALGEKPSEAAIAAAHALALEIFTQLPLHLQTPFIYDVFYTELRETGRAATQEGETFERGDMAIAMLFPDDAETTDDDYHGDIRLFASQLRTVRGGNIDIIAPGGLVNAGLANPPGGLDKEASELGIVTQGGGSIRAFVQDDFLVNQSRVFTLCGGDILIWS